MLLRWSAIAPVMKFTPELMRKASAKETSAAGGGRQARRARHSEEQKDHDRDGNGEQEQAKAQLAERTEVDHPLEIDGLEQARRDVPARDLHADLAVDVVVDETPADPGDRHVADHAGEIVSADRGAGREARVDRAVHGGVSGDEHEIRGDARVVAQPVGKHLQKRHARELEIERAHESVTSPR